MPSQKRVKIAGLTLPPPPLVFALQSLSSPSGWCFFSLPPPHSGAASFCQYIPVPNLFSFSLILSTFYYQPNVYLLLLGKPRSTNECNFPELSSVNSESFGTFTSCMSQFFLALQGITYAPGNLCHFSWVVAARLKGLVIKDS